MQLTSVKLLTHTYPCLQLNNDGYTVIFMNNFIKTIKLIKAQS